MPILPGLPVVALWPFDLLGRRANLATPLAPDLLQRGPLTRLVEPMLQDVPRVTRGKAVRRESLQAHLPLRFFFVGDAWEVAPDVDGAHLLKLWRHEAAGAAA